MNTTIIGSGNMGKGIATRFVVGGHSVTFVDNDIEIARSAATEIQQFANGGAIVSAAGLENVELGDVVVLAVWYGTNMEVVKQLGDRLKGKVVVDIANPLNQTYDGLATALDSSSAEDVARVLPNGATLVKAFNTTFAGTLSKGKVADQQLDVFIAGDDSKSKELVAQLVTDGGMRAIDSGPLQRSRLLESMQLLQIVLQGTLGTNWGSTIKILN